MVLAGPGSGKTTVITERICQLLYHQVDPGTIMVITFTRAAAEEMKHRFQKLWRERKSLQPGEGNKSLYEGKPADPDGIRFGTFHSIFFSVLREELDYTEKNILKMQEKEELLRILLEERNLEQLSDPDPVRQILSELSTAEVREALQRSGSSDRGKTGGEAAGSGDGFRSKLLPDAVFREIQLRMREEKKRQRKIDFEDMLIDTYRLFLTRPDILKKWQKRAVFLLLDEFQDISPLQFRIVQLLARPENNIFLVGDDDQSIYGFRGASPEIMLNIPKLYPDTRRIVLSQNFRSLEEIVRLSQRVIRDNETRFPKQLSPVKDTGGRTMLYPVENEEAEYRSIASLIREHWRKGGALSECAILFRMNRLAREVMPYLMEQNIPFVLREQVPGIFSQSIIRDFMAYLRISDGLGRRSDLLQIWNKPLRYLSRKALEGREEKEFFSRILHYYRNNPQMERRVRRLITDLRALHTLPTESAFRYFRKEISYDSYLSELLKGKSESWKEAEELMEEFSSLALKYPEHERFYHFAEDYEKERKKRDMTGEAQRDAVQILTYHGSKGLEFDCVYLPDVVEQLVPYKKAKTEAELEEERRCFYVALSRAKTEIHIYVTKERYHKPYKISRFLEFAAGG